MSFPVKRLGLVLLLVLPLSGCIRSYKKIHLDPERTKISFATPLAGKNFYEVLGKIPAARESSHGRTGVHLIVLHVETETVTGPNQVFNDAVVYCDTDKDGVITELEVEVFAESSFAKQK